MASRVPAPERRRAAALLFLLLAAASALPAQKLTCEELQAKAQAHRRAEEIWLTEPPLKPAELARRAGVPRKQARAWIARWQGADSEERDCKLYPPQSDALAEAGGDAAPGPARVSPFRLALRHADGREREALTPDRRFQQRLSLAEKAACGPRLAACYYFVVDCELPPRLRRIGRRMPSISPRRWVRTTAGECKERRGEFRLPDSGEQTGQPTTMWERDAELGRACAQNYLGEIHQRRNEYAEARRWFARAAAQAYTNALINLGNLYEKGLGGPPDPLAALDCYEAATGEEGLLLAELATDLPPKTRATAVRKLRGPILEVVDPWIPHHRPRIPIGEGDTKRRLFGRIFAVARIEELELIGDDSEPLDPDVDLTFEFEIPLARDHDSFTFDLSVSDTNGKKDNVEFTLTRGADRSSPPPAPRDRGSGNYHALLIGIDEYRQSDAFMTLDTPVSDVMALQEVLTGKWGFETPALLANGEATFEAILRHLDEYRRTLTAEDSLLIYFAGHGRFREDEFGHKDGFWLPYDAEDDAEDDDKQRTWISSLQIAHQVETMRAGNVLIMADSCFSGFLSRSTIAPAAGTRSVAVLTSAGDTEALDLAAGGRSPFAGAVLEVLENWDDRLAATDLATKVQTAFSEYKRQCANLPEPDDRASCQALANLGQEPQFRPPREARHQGGVFIFVPSP